MVKTKVKIVIPVTMVKEETVMITSKDSMATVTAATVTDHIKDVKMVTVQTMETDHLTVIMEAGIDHSTVTMEAETDHLTVITTMGIDHLIVITMAVKVVVLLVTVITVEDQEVMTDVEESQAIA